MTGKIKSTTLPRQRRRAGKGTKAVGQNGEGDPDEEAEPADGEDQVLWSVGNASDDDDDFEEIEGEDEDVDHHQHPLHQELPTGRIAGMGAKPTAAPRGARSVIDEHTELVGSESHDSDPLELQRRDDADAAKKRRSMDPFRDNAEDEHELDEFTSVGSRAGLTQR